VSFRSLECLVRGSECKMGQRLLIKQCLAFSNVKVVVPSQIVEVREGRARLYLANFPDFPVRARKSRLHLVSCELVPDPESGKPVGFFCGRHLPADRFRTDRLE
jgi:hypothetical protein